MSRVVAVNLTVPMQLMRLAWHYMRLFRDRCAQPHDASAADTSTMPALGTIINVSSIGSGFNADHAQFIPTYSSTKAGLDQFSRAIAKPALVTDNVHVYTLNPGVVDTDMGRGVVHSRFPFETLEAFAGEYNVEGEAATAADIAGVVVDLAQGRTHGYRPGDAIACYARGMTVDMAALTSTVHQSSLRGGVALDETHPRLLAERHMHTHGKEER